ncbi:MAG: SelT/SelW/SelH family protein [Desulfuromonadales bacterium]|nr:SelT/SelW/SelH family protein [Desulfuromonadales bacterium]MBN2791041.1 SelT/SelW/SelH family protein [Desulfuromonadales bacterium]
MKEKFPDIEVEIVAGELKSEFAILINDTQVFSRLEERRFPELDDVLELCRQESV